jgi:hypothetical protein
MASLRDNDPPRTLPFLIGDLCGKRAGVPSIAEMGRSAMGSLFAQTPDYASKLLPGGIGAPDADIEAAFLSWLGGMTHLQRYRVLEPFYRRVPVPLFYQDLASLVLSGFIAHILTTNVDTLLEQALEAVGLAAGRDYAIQVLGSPDPPSTMRGSPVTIVKLYGDLGQEQLPMGPDEIDRVVNENRSFLRSELASDLVVVGHEISVGPPRAIDRWLVARGGGPIWWAHPEEPSADVAAMLSGDRPVTYLTGEDGDPEGFFGQLNLHLIRLPTVAVLGSEGASAGGDLEQEYLKGRIEKAQVSKYSYEQSASSEQNVGLQAQIGYQATTAASYGNQLRELRPLDLGQLMTRVVSEAQTAGADHGTVEFLSQQAQIVEREQAADQPNQLVINGAVSAVASVAQGMAQQLSPDLTADLRTAASATGPT